MRLLALLALGFAILVGVAGTVVAALLVPEVYPSTPERLLAEGVVAEFAVAYLAAVASIVALIAFHVASRRPRLTVRVKFADSEPNKPVLPYSTPASEGDQLIELDQAEDLRAEIAVLNRSRHFANNPYVRMELVNLTGLAVQNGWTPVKREYKVGATAIAWEGRVIHDRHDLPVVSFAGVKMLKGAKRYGINVHVSAQGYARSFSMPVELLKRDDWRRRTEQSTVRH
jgi:hypothetical protein